MKQFQAGYFLSGILDLFLNQTERKRVEKIVFQLCHFDIDTNDDLTYKSLALSPEIKVINNLILRGLPTRPSNFIEELFATSFGLTKREISENKQINFSFIDDKLKEELFRAIHLIDPRIKKEDFDRKFEGKNADFKEDFFNSYIPEYLGADFLQLVETDRTYNSLINNTLSVQNKSEIK
ncbi:MAG: hypothetical protein JXR51_15855, partial [Bacteroidales bacterium]|nr:hypothetical protein [Bacteroidales bacterium]